MPFVANMDDEQQQNPNAPQGAVAPTGGGGGTVRLSPSSAVPTAGSGGPGGTSTGQNPGPTAGGQFASLQNYLSANQGQAAPIAGMITPGINKQYNDLNAANNATIAGIGSQVANAPGYTPSNPNLMAAEAANPVSFTSNPGNVKQFQSLLNNTYSGPASAESTSDYSNQQNAINQAIATGQSQTGTEAGRENLISQTEAAPTGGTTALNEAILSQDPNALASIQQAYDPFKNLLTGLQSGASDVNKQIAQEQADAAASAKAAQDAIASQSTALNTNINQSLTAAQQKAAAQNADVTQAFRGLYGNTPLNTNATTLGTYGGGSTPWVNTTNYNVNALTPQTAAELGLTADQATALQGALQKAATSQYMTGHNFGAGSGTTQLDLSQFLQQQDPTQAITAANIATPDQYAREQAFQTLLGKLPTGAILDPTQAAAAGTAPTNLNTFDYNTALAAAQQTAAAERQQAQDEANALTGGADLAHAQSQHGHGVFGALQNAVTHPGTLLATIANPMSYGANLNRVLSGQNINPKDISAPYAKAVAPAVGGVIGAIYGGPAGALGGASAGQALGAPLQSLGGQAGKPYASGGTVVPSKREEQKPPFKKLIDNLYTGAK